MDAIWLVLAFVGGGCIGFLLFAVLQMSRAAARKPKREFKLVMHPFDLEGDTITRY